MVELSIRAEFAPLVRLLVAQHLRECKVLRLGYSEMQARVLMAEIIEQMGRPERDAPEVVKAAAPRDVIPDHLRSVRGV
jgi:hypothetical protein